MEILNLLKKMIQHHASDLFLTVGLAPMYKVHHKVFALSTTSISQQVMTSLVLGIMNDAQQQEYERTHECNFAFEAENVGRFRISVFMQRGHIGAVIRYIQSRIPSLEELNLPIALKALVMIPKGLILVVGSSAAGKTTTVASLVDYRNTMGKGHILTIEDPIEYLHNHKRCIVTQREVGVDTASFEIAMKNALSQAPDLIQISEVKDLNAMRYALSYAQAGHLCISTLHANNVQQALEKIASFYSQSLREQLWLDLSMNLKGIIAQQALSQMESNKSVIATEVLINTPIIAQKIRYGQITVLNDYMMRKNGQGMHTFDQSLYRLCIDGKITYQEALLHAESANNLRLMLKLKMQTPEIQKNRQSDNRGSSSVFT